MRRLRLGKSTSEVISTPPTNKIWNNELTVHSSLNNESKILMSMRKYAFRMSIYVNLLDTNPSSNGNSRLVTDA